MPSPFKRDLSDRVEALESAVKSLRSEVAGDRDEDVSPDSEDEADSEPSKASEQAIRPVRGMSTTVDLTHPDFVKLEIVDWRGVTHSFFVRPHGLALLLPAAAEGRPPAPAGLLGDNPDDEVAFARARLTNAEAERIELEIAATRRSLALSDDSPLAAHSVSVDNEQLRPGERIIRIGFRDGAGRSALVVLPFGLALKLNGSIARAVAERLNSEGVA